MIRTVSNKFVRGVSIGLTVTATGVSLYFLHRSDYEISSIGLVRLARAGATVSRIVLDYKLAMRRGKYDEEMYRKTISETHRRSAERLLQLACTNGGVYIKVGQHIAALEYLLPKEYVKILSILHSKAPESDLGDVRRVIEEDLKCKMEDVFTDFHEKPCGAASLAQVYKAKLKTTGEEVAVKVQHLRVKAHSFVDIASMEVLIKIVAKLFPDFKLLWLMEETKRNLPNELDFTSEAANAERIRRMLSSFDFLKIPKIYHDLSSDRILTMEFCDGAQIDDLDYFLRNGIDRHDICRKLGSLYSEMIFVNGYVHCDPHPGNVLIQKDSDGKASIVLLDHGLYLTLRDDFRLKYAKFWLALLKPDQTEIKRLAIEMGVGDLYGLFTCMVTNRSWKSVLDGINKSAVCESEYDEIRAYAANLLPQISQVLHRMPRPMLLILKTNDLLRSIERRLGTHKRTDAFIQMSRCCIRSVHEVAVRNEEYFLRRFLIRLSMYWALLKILLYEKYLKIFV